LALFGVLIVAGTSLVFQRRKVRSR
jgi:hypothetical protein